MTGFLEPVVLAGERRVSLEPLTPDHTPEIATAALDVAPLWFTSPHFSQNVARNGV